MKAVFQNKFSNAEGTEHGNCFDACVASLLELPLEDVPPFTQMGTEWIEPFFKFLDAHGYKFCGTARPITHEKGEHSLTQYRGIDGYMIVEGKSPRQYVTRGHAVIYKDGVLAHDPHPSGDGLLEIENWLMIERKENL